MQPATQLGPYRLLRPLGAGGMGEVWLAEHAQLGVQRAVKLLSHHVDAEALLRFQREAQAMAALNHPNVARIHERGDYQGRPYLVLDLLPGGDLAARLREAPLGLAEADQLLAALAAGLEHMHQQGVLHRDIKPANVLFDQQGQPQWVDFGLARLAGAGSLTESGTIMGTPGYMSPEQALGDRGEIDARTDVYGLGSLLYHCLCGQPPFSGGSLPAIIHQVVNAPPAPPSALRPGLPGAVDAVCLRALAKRGADRFATPTELAEAFSRATRGSPARPPGLRRWVLAAGLLTVVALAGGIAAWRARPGPTPPSPIGTTPDAAPGASAPQERPLHAAESPPTPPSRFTIELPGETQSLVAFAPNGELRIVTSEGRLLASRPPGSPPTLVTYATPRTLARDFWQGARMAISGATVGPVRWVDNVSQRLKRDPLDSLTVDPSRGVAILGLAKGGCRRLGLEDPLQPLEPWIAPPSAAHRPRAITRLGQAILVAWNKTETEGTGPEETQLILYDPSGEQLAVRQFGWRLRSFTNPEPDVVLAGDRFGILHAIAWDGETLDYERWKGRSITDIAGTLWNHMPSTVEGLAAAGPAESRTLYAISRPIAGGPAEGKRVLRAWSWNTAEVVSDAALDSNPRNMAISPGGDWLALGTDQEQVLLYRLNDGAPAWD